MARLTLMLMAALTASCASASPYGNFLEHASTQVEASLALDTAAQLRRAYSPAVLSLKMPDCARDPFGQALLRRLRRIGFAVVEDGVSTPPNSVTVRYVVDQLDDQFYLVTLVLRRSRDGAALGRMSRAYAERAGAVHPAGPWTRQTVGMEASSWTTN